MLDAFSYLLAICSKLCWHNRLVSIVRTDDGKLTTGISTDNVGLGEDKISDDDNTETLLVCLVTACVPRRKIFVRFNRIFRQHFKISCGAYNYSYTQLHTYMAIATYIAIIISWQVYIGLY